MTKVYISQMTRAGMDFSSAEEYGEVIPVFPSSMNAYGGVAATAEFVDMARQRMAEMTQDDYLVLVGDCNTKLFLFECCTLSLPHVHLVVHFKDVRVITVQHFLA